MKRCGICGESGRVPVMEYDGQEWHTVRWIVCPGPNDKPCPVTSALREPQR